MMAAMKNASMDAPMHFTRRRLCAAMLFACVQARAGAAASTTAAADRQVALVIGNSNYRVGALKNPVNDAQAVATSVRGLGFDVTLRQNT